MKGRIAVSLGVAALVIASTGTMGASASSSVGSRHIHVLLTVPMRKKAGVGTGCFGTGSPGCLPIPMQYNGGPVEAGGSHNYLIFWEPTGSTVASNYNATLQQFFGDIGGSSLYGVAAQYYQTVNGANQNIANSATLGGAWTDTTAYPSGSLQDSQVQSEVAKAIQTNGWPTGNGNEYFVYLSKGESECMGTTCSFSTFCAYHGTFSSGTATVLYAAMPYAGTDLSGCGIQSGGGTPNGADTDAEISIASHELMETVTDPQLNAWFDATGAEIGDKCAYTYGATNADGSDITINSHAYIVQEEFSNSNLGCAI